MQSLTDQVELKVVGTSDRRCGGPREECVCPVSDDVTAVRARGGSAEPPLAVGAEL